MSDFAKAPFDAGIAALSRAIEEGAVSPVEVVNASLERAEATNAVFNAFIAISRDRALRFAKAAECATRDMGDGLYRTHG